MKYLQYLGVAAAMAASGAGGAVLSRSSAPLVDGTKIALLSEANGLYVVAEDVTIPGLPGKPLIANRAAPYGWETFTIKVMHAPEVPPPPPPPPPDAAWKGCGATLGADLVGCVQTRLGPLPRTVEGAFEVTQRVAWLLRGSGFVLLLKPGGENIISWQGYSFSAGRICQRATGQLIKILSDVPATNGPSWQDNGTIALASCDVPVLEPEN